MGFGTDLVGERGGGRQRDGAVVDRDERDEAQRRHFLLGDERRAVRAHAHLIYADRCLRSSIFTCAIYIAIYIAFIEHR